MPSKKTDAPTDGQDGTQGAAGAQDAPSIESAADAPAEAQVGSQDGPAGQGGALALAGSATGAGELAANGTDALFESFAGHGMEKVTSKDVLVPRLGILQSLSPQLKRQNSAYIEGASVGDICDLGTGELMPRPLHVLPVVYDKTWIEWFPRASGKGIAQIHLTDDILSQTKQDDKGRLFLPNGNSVIETAQMYLLNLTAGRRPSFLPFSSTQLKKARRWLTLAQGEKLVNSAGHEYTPPLFFRTYYLETVMENNSQGDWAGWAIRRGPALPDIENWKNVMQSAINFRSSIMAGIAKADASAMQEDETVIDGRAESSNSSETRM